MLRNKTLLIMIYAPNLFSKISESYLEQSSPHEHQTNELTHVHFIVNTSNVICKLSYLEFMMLYTYVITKFQSVHHLYSQFQFQLFVYSDR